MTTLGNIEQLTLTADINDKVVSCSMLLDDNAKQAFKDLAKYTRDLLKKEPKMSSYKVNSLKNSILTYWNESINPDTEKFWTELKANGIEYERKEPLQFALDKKRFKRVEQGIDARKHWTELKTLKEVQQRFIKTEIEELDDIISKDEKQRIKILKGCLNKKQIPHTQYLKFGECMAYANNCGLLDKYLTKLEVEELYDTWNNFKSK